RNRVGVAPWVVLIVRVHRRSDGPQWAELPGERVTDGDGTLETGTEGLCRRAEVDDVGTAKLGDRYRGAGQGVFDINRVGPASGRHHDAADLPGVKSGRLTVESDSHAIRAHLTCWLPRVNCDRIVRVGVLVTLDGQGIGACEAG